MRPSTRLDAIDCPHSAHQCIALVSLSPATPNFPLPPDLMTPHPHRPGRGGEQWTLEPKAPPLPISARGARSHPVYLTSPAVIYPCGFCGPCWRSPARPCAPPRPPVRRLHTPLRFPMRPRALPFSPARPRMPLRAPACPRAPPRTLARPAAQEHAPAPPPPPLPYRAPNARPTAAPCAARRCNVPPTAAPCAA